MLAKRIIAYIVDSIFIILLTSMIAQIRFLNPSYDEYYELQSKYLEITEEALNQKDYSFMNSDEFKNLSYDQQKASVSNTIIGIIVYLGYFVLFQIWNKGQTLGKKLMKIKVISTQEKELKWSQLFIRTIISYGIYANVLCLCFLFVLSKDHYLALYNLLGNITTIIFYVIVIMIILRKDGLGLHDIIAKTKVEME